MKPNRLICLVRGGCNKDRALLRVDFFDFWEEGAIKYAQCTRCGKIYKSDLAKVKTWEHPNGLDHEACIDKRYA